MQITFTENDDLDAVDRVLQALRGTEGLYTQQFGRALRVGPYTYRESSDSEISDSMRQAAEGVECRTVEIPTREEGAQHAAASMARLTDKEDQDIAKVFESLEQPGAASPVAAPKPPLPTAPPVTGTPTTSEPVGAPKPHAPTATGSGSSAPCLASHATAGAELDANGMPWDGRIHASTKTKVKAGTWKPKRKVDPELVKQVEAELGTAPSADVTPPAASTPPPPPPPPRSVKGDTPKPASPDASLFQKLVKHLIDHKLADSPQFKEAAAAVGVAGFPELGHPDNIDKLQSVCAALGVI